MHNRYDSIMTRIGYSYLPGTGHGPTTNEAISQFEQAIGYDLPEDYKTFVQKYGFTMGRGGTRFGNLDNPDQDETSIGVFYGIGSDDSFGLLSKKEGFADDLPPHLLPIASSPGGQIVLSLAGQDVAKIYWWSPHRGSDDVYDDLRANRSQF